MTKSVLPQAKDMVRIGESNDLGLLLQQVHQVAKDFMAMRVTSRSGNMGFLEKHRAALDRAVLEFAFQMEKNE